MNKPTPLQTLRAGMQLVKELGGTVTSEVPKVSDGMGGHHRPIGYTDTWLTPRWILDKLDHFDTDPCCPPDMPWKTADRMYTIVDNGLMQPWVDRVWCNPPYGNDAKTWLERLAAHGNGIALIFARTETDAFHRHVWGKADGIMFLRGRIDFLRADGKKHKGTGRNGNAGAPSCLVAYGAENLEILRAANFDGALVAGWRS